MGDINDDLVTGGGFAIAQALGTGHDQLIGRVIDKYRIVRVIAEGGMGLVCEAEQVDDSIERSVALKLSHASFLKQDEDQRFQAEKAILASLQHAGISHLYDAGFSEEGWPYFVMELVDGQHADEWARDKPTESVVEKFIDVCQALAYAHARLVIHRDIKPSNVLIDERDQAKVVDFGIAKILTAAQNSEATQNALSPSYASPEQLRADILTTATDIYQLGGLLRHLLGTVEEVDLKVAIERAVRGQDVQLSSKERAKLGRELSAIIERCLRHEPGDRYASAEALIADLRAWQGGYAVAAVSQSTGYRMARFVRRNVIGVSATALALVITVTLAGIAIYEGQRAEQALVAAIDARDTAQQVTGFISSIFEKANPDGKNPDDISVREVLDQGYQAAQEELSDRPRVLVSVLTSVANAYYELGALDQNAEITRLILDAARSSGGENDVEVGRALLNYGQAISRQDLPDSNVRAEPIALEAIDYLEALDPPSYRLLGLAYNSYGNVLNYTSRQAQARDAYATAAEEFQKANPPLYRNIADAYQNIAVTWLDTPNASAADIAKAVEQFELAQDVVREYGVESQSASVTIALNLGASYLLLNEPAKARASIEPVYAYIMEVYPSHPRAVYATRLLGNAAVLEGRYDEAREQFNAALDISERIQGGARNILFGVVTSYIAELEALQGNEAEATKLYADAFEYFGSPGNPAEAMDYIAERVEWYPVERLPIID